MSNPDDTRLTASDRFVANWLIEKIQGLSDAKHAEIFGYVRRVETRLKPGKDIREPGDDDQ